MRGREERKRAAEAERRRPRELVEEDETGVEWMAEVAAAVVVQVEEEELDTMEVEERKRNWVDSDRRRGVSR